MSDGKSHGLPARSRSRGGHGAGPPRPNGRPPGYEPRAAAVRIVSQVLDSGHALDEALERAFAAPGAAGIEPRDRAFARLIAVTVLRRLGELDAVVNSFLERPLPARQGLLSPILLCAGAQLLCLDTPPHAAISLAVDQCRADTGARRFDRLANALLRRVATQGRERLAALDAVTLNTPGWLMARWQQTYGQEEARAIAAACGREAALDLSVKADAAGWAERLGGTVLPTGSVRLLNHGRIEELAGYADGGWWVQDAAAALPGRLLGDVAGRTVADLCAAPGGKTAELAAAGAMVTAVDVSKNRLVRLQENLDRLALTAEVVAADVTSWQPGRQFDAVLLDAPCTATGTIRRHPDIWRLKRPEDVAHLAALQARLLDNAATLVAPGGVLVYCSCSLEPEEGAGHIGPFLAQNPAFTREPVGAAELAGLADAITPEGCMRTLPTHLPNDNPALSGLDGFFAARLRRG